MTLLKVERRAVASGSPTYNPFENPAVPLASIGLDAVFGRANTDAGLNVSPEVSFSVPTVFRCVSLLSTVIASCPLNVWKEPDKKLVRTPLLDRGNPDTTYTQFELWELVVTYLALWGNAYIFKKRDPENGRIVDLKPLFPGLVKVKLDADGNKIFLVRRVRPDGTIEPHDDMVLSEWEIMHIPGLGYDGLVGLSPINAAAQAVGTAIAGDKLAARFYSSGSILGGIIKVKAPLRSQTQADGIKRRWMSMHGGVGNAGDVAILDAETDFQQLTIPPDALQFLESRRWQTTEIARLFGIPPHLIGDVEKSTSWGTGIEQQNIGFRSYTIAGWTSRIEQRVTREIVCTRGQFAEFDMDSLLRGSMTERYAAYAQAAGGPWMLRDEVRLKENMAPLGGEAETLLPPQGIGPPEGDQEENGQ